MAKLYIHKATHGDYRLRGDADSARSWPSSAAAEGYCIYYEHFCPLMLDTFPSATRIACRGFKVEERRPEQFVIFCEMPDAVLPGLAQSSEHW